jgi:hypothetical protein
MAVFTAPSADGESEALNLLFGYKGRKKINT